MKGKGGLPGEKKGFTLLETLIALGILAVIGVVFLSALATNSRNALIQDEQLTAENLARTQLEIIMDSLYLPSYDNLKITAPFQYSIAVTPQYVDKYLVVVDYDTCLQKITVAVSREGKPLLRVEALKIKL